MIFRRGSLDCRNNLTDIAGFCQIAECSGFGPRISKPIALNTFYYDADGNGYPNRTALNIAPPAGYVIPIRFQRSVFSDRKTIFQIV